MQSGRFSIPWSKADPFDAAYFCVTSLATIGYGDLVPVTRLDDFSPWVYIIAGLGVLSAFIAAITQVSVEQMELRRQNHVPLRPCAIGVSNLLAQASLIQ